MSAVFVLNAPCDGFRLTGNTWVTVCCTVFIGISPLRVLRQPHVEDLLGVYGMKKLRSEPGEKRNPRHCQILGRIPTGDPAKHDTVAKSYNSGFYIGNRTVIKEVVVIYIIMKVQ